MSLLRPGSKSLVFVTHVDFFRAKCHIFCQVGDVGSQADTVAERVAESVETGTAGPVSSCNRGDLCLALFRSDNSWYRAKVLKTAGTSVTVFFIDYGNTEVVDISNVRQANDFVLSMPALSTNCIVADCTPLGDCWSEEEKKKTETMLLNGEYNVQVLSVEAENTEHPVYTVKLYNLEDGSSPIFVRPASSSSLAIPVQILNVGQSYEVFLSYVESADKFWVQLKDQENDLNSLMADVAACFAEDLPSTGDLISPVKGQLCASCFSEDGAFYRSVVEDLRGDKCTVLFIDYGNYEEKSVSELFTLPQVLCKLPMQGIKCSYKADGNDALISSTLEKYAATDSSYIMTVVAAVGHNQYAVQISSIEELLVSKAPSPKKPHSQQQGAPKVQNSMWQSYQAVFMQVGSIYDVCISHADFPGSFFIQLVANAPALDDLMDSIDKVAHNFEKISNLYTGCTCLAQFGDNAWYRGQILSVKPTTAKVGAVDFGHVEELSHNKLKVIPSNYTQLPAQAISCSLDFSKGGKEMWTDGECDLFKQFIEKKSLAAKVTSKKGFTYQLDLYEMGDKERHINSELNSLPKSARSFEPAQSQFGQPALSRRKPSLPNPEAAVGSKIVLMFTAVKMPFLYGQLTHTPVKKVAQLQTDLNNYFEKNNREQEQISDIGTVCCTQYVDGGWYRGIVVSITGSKIEVAFADFGDSVFKTLQDLKALPAHLLELPQQCILFKAENIPVLTQEKAEKVLINTKVEVTLTKKEEGAFPTFSGQIISRQVLEKLLDNPAPSQGVFKGASSRTFGSSRQPKDLRPSTSSSAGFSQQQVTVGSSQEVMVTYVKDPSNFMVVLDKMNSSLDVVMDEMHEFYDVLPPDGERLENPGLGQPCVAQFSEDKAWYRAVVTGLKSSGPAEVMYVDYGNNEYTDREALKNIKPQYMNLPAQAILCSLSGVASAQGFWSPEHIVQFEEMVLEQSFMANFCSSFHEQGQLVHKVELLDKKGESINQKFGAKTSTLSVEKGDTSRPSRGFGASNMGGDMKITVNVGDGDSGWDESEDTRQVGFGNKASFGGRQERGAGDAASGGQQERGGFGGGFRRGDLGRAEGGRLERSFGGRADSGGFGNRSENQGFRSGGGFGGGGESGFGKKSDSDGFGRQGSGGGFASRSEGSGFGERRGGGGGRECFKCGEEGHMARDCPNPAKGGGGRGGRECFKCGEVGHMARDCPIPGKGGDRRGGGFNSDTREDRRGGGFGSGGSSGERHTGGFGGRSGGFGNRPAFGANNGGFTSNNTEDDWGDSDSGTGQKVSDRSDSSVGQRGFGNRGGGFGQDTRKPEGFGNRSGGFGAREGGGRGFVGNAPTGGFGGVTQEEDDWGADDTASQPPQLGTQGNSGAMRQTTEVNNESVMDSSLQVHELQLHDAVDVYVVYTNSPDQFWCQVIKSSKQLEDMMEEMNGVYESLKGTDLNLVNPNVGMPCAAKFSEDNMWYRAEIITPNAEEIEVLFIDYGNTEILPASNMKQLKPEFTKLKAQGLRCSLDGVLPTNKVWTNEASQCFEELTIDKHLLAKVMNTTSSGTYLVDLENVEDKINIAEKLAEKGLCSFSVTKPVTSVKSEHVMSPYPSLDMKAGEEVDVYLSWIESPEKFWVQIASRESTLLELVDRIQEEYTTGSGASMKVTSPKVGDSVVSTYSEDGAWYRGFVEDIAGEDYSVRFTDYGNADKVSKDSLRLPTDELLLAPSEAAYCKLTGIRPLQGGSWTVDAKDIMDSLVKDILVKCKVVEISKKQFSVILVANDVDVSKELINAAVAREEKEQVVQDMETKQPLEVGKVLTFRENGFLQIGASEKVYVAHTDSVASFWCQLVRTASLLEELMTKLESHCQSALAAHQPRVGAACAAKFSEDAQWYRAKVIAAYPDSVEVLFVDYGNCEKVSNTDLCTLSEELVELEPQAIQCELENVSNASNQLTAKFTELVGDQEVTAKVIDVQEGMATVNITLSDGRSVDAELGLSKVPEVAIIPAKEEDKTSILTSYPKQVVPSRAEVFISHVNTFADFYVHRADQEEQLNKLMEKISEYYEAGNIPEVENISKNEICCCIFTEDGAWYRAQVQDVDENKVKVKYVDYGNEEKVTLDSIKHLPPKFSSLAPFAVQCSLVDVKPDHSGSEDLVETFKNLTADKVLGCEFISEKTVKLKLDGTDIVEILIESDKCIKVREKSESSDDILLFSSQSVPTEPVSCYVSHICTTGEVYVQLVSEEETLNSITETIQTVEKHEPLDLTSVRIKQCLCARFCEDQNWYRSMVTAVKEGSVEVLFVDYGNKQSVTDSADLRSLSRENVVTPPLAYACRLPGVEQLSEDQVEILIASTADKELTVTFLSTKPLFEVGITDENGDKMEKVLEMNQDDGSMRDDKVEEITEAISTVTVAQSPANSDPRDELQGDISTAKKNLEQEDTGAPETVGDGDVSKDVMIDKEPDNDELDRQPDQDESPEHTETDSGIETITDAVSNVAVESSKEFVNELTEEITPVDVESELECTEEDSDTHQINLDKIVTHKDQLEKQTLSSDQRFKVVVSHSDSPSRLWVQDLQFQTELDELLNNMFEFYSTCTDERLMLDDVREDQIVAALYSGDESWYRAKIESVKDEDCSVIFLDHGNTEAVTCENLRKLPLEFATLPVQGIPCSLGAVQPCGGEWSEEAIAEFYKLTQDKELLMDVSSQEDGVYKVSLLDMGMSLNTLLIEKGVGAEEATPVAISSKLKQVFSPDTQDVIAQLYVAKASNDVGKYGYVLRDLSEFLTSNQTVVVTEVSSPHDFTCRLEDDSYGYYQDKLVEAYTVKKEELQNPKQGDKCVVKLEMDDKFFHRASIISVVQDAIKLVLVDTGIEKSVATTNLYVLETDFEKDPALAFQCSLSAIMPVKEEWSEESTLVFCKALLEFSSRDSLPAFAKAQIVSVEAEVVNVEIYLGKTSMDDVLITKEVAVLYDRDKTIDENDTSDLVIDRFGVFQNVILDCDKDHYVNLENCDSLDEIVVYTSEGLNILKEIEETIKEFTRSKSEELGLADNYSSGPCLARSNGEWCRANLLTVTSKEEKIYRVFLVDYGSEYAVKREDIMALPEDLLKIPGQAVICHLDEIEPFEAEWGEDSLELFRSHYLSDQADIVIYVSSYDNGYHSVVLTKASETNSANKMLVELGFASPVAGSSLEMSVMIDNAETSFQELSLMRQDSYGESDGLGDTSSLTETSTDTAISDADRSTDTVEEKESAFQDTQHSVDETLDEISCVKKENGLENTCGINGNIAQEILVDNIASEDTNNEHANDRKGIPDLAGNEFMLAEPSSASCGMGLELDPMINKVDSSVNYNDNHMSGNRSEIRPLENSTTEFQNTDADIEYCVNDTTDLENNIAELDNTTAGREDGFVASANAVTDFENRITKIGNTNAEFENHACNFDNKTTDFESSSTDLENTTAELESSTIEFDNRTHEFESSTTNFENTTTEFDTSNTDYGNESTDLENSDIKFEDTAYDLGNSTADYENVTGDLGNTTTDTVNSKSDCETSAADLDTSTTDINPQSTEESELDESYFRIGPRSPTGYTTSELDTTDLRDIDSTDIDTSDVLAEMSLFAEDDLSCVPEKTAVNMTDKVEKFESILHDKEIKETVKNVHLDTDENEMMSDVDINKDSIEGSKCVAVPKELEQRNSWDKDEGQVIDDNQENDQIEKDRYYPSACDTTYPSTISSIGDTTFTSIGESSETDSMLICMDCDREVSSFLETTGCESEFSFYVCPVCKTWDNGNAELEMEPKDSFITNVDHEEIVLSSALDVLCVEYDENESSQSNDCNDPEDFTDPDDTDRTSSIKERKNVLVCEVSKYPMTDVMKNSEEYHPVKGFSKDVKKYHLQTDVLKNSEECQEVDFDDLMVNRDNVQTLIPSGNDEVIDKDHIYSLKEIEGFNNDLENAIEETDVDFLKPKQTCQYSPSGTDVDAAYFNIAGNICDKPGNIEDNQSDMEEPIVNKDDCTEKEGKDNESENRKSLVTKFFSFILSKKNEKQEVINTNNSCSSVRINEEYVDIPDDQCSFIDTLKKVNNKDSSNADSEDSLKDAVESNEDISQKSENYFTCELDQTEDEGNDMDDNEVVETVLFSILDNVVGKCDKKERYFEGKSADLKEDNNRTISSPFSESKENKVVKDTLVGLKDYKDDDKTIGGFINQAEENVGGKDVPMDDVSANRNSLPVEHDEFVQTIYDRKACNITGSTGISSLVSHSDFKTKESENKAESIEMTNVQDTETLERHLFAEKKTSQESDVTNTATNQTGVIDVTYPSEENLLDDIDSKVKSETSACLKPDDEIPIRDNDNFDSAESVPLCDTGEKQHQEQAKEMENFRDDTKEEDEHGVDIDNSSQSSAKCLPAIDENNAAGDFSNPYPELFEYPAVSGNGANGATETKDTTEQVKVLDQAVENCIKDPEEDDNSDKDYFEDADDKVKASREGSLEKGTKEEEGEDFYDVEEDVKE